MHALIFGNKMHQSTYKKFDVQEFASTSPLSSPLSVFAPLNGDN